jgi:hypothetical protein
MLNAEIALVFYHMIAISQREATARDYTQEVKSVTNCPFGFFGIAVYIRLWARTRKVVSIKSKNIEIH